FTVLTQTGSTSEESQDRLPLGIPGRDQRLRDDAVVDELGVERSLATAAQLAGCRQRADGADRQGEGREGEDDLQCQPMAEAGHDDAHVTLPGSGSLCRLRRLGRLRRMPAGSGPAGPRTRESPPPTGGDG